MTVYRMRRELERQIEAQNRAVDKSTDSIEKWRKYKRMEPNVHVRGPYLGVQGRQGRTR